jgi:hypothetical protein
MNVIGGRICTQSRRIIFLDLDVADITDTSIVDAQVKLNWKYNLVWALVLPALAWFCAGCSGINSTQSVSPASFFLPGLLKAEPKPNQPDKTVPAMEPVRQVAQLQ